MIKPNNRQSGFTIVELLITLFVAAAFLVSGYQLYALVIKDSGQTRATSRASNVAYDYMRQYSASTTSPCVASTPLSNSAISVSGLSSVTVTVNISCPYMSQPDLSRVEVIVQYNNPQQTVRSSTYASSGTSTTNSLVGWWKFNGNANDSSGNGNNGTVSGATLATGQNGVSNGSYSFNGTDNLIRMATSNWPATMDAITISFWAKPSAVSATSVVLANPDDGANRLNVHLPWSDSSIYWDFGNCCTAGRISTTFNSSWLNVWASWAFTVHPTTGMVIYRNGSPIASNSNRSTFTPGGKTLDLGYYVSNNSYWSGLLDDVRIYNRALTATEISSLYAEGAQ